MESSILLLVLKTMKTFTLGDPLTEYYAHLHLWEPESPNEPYIVTEFICAYGRGSEMLAEMCNAVQDLCNNLKEPIVHTYNATNAASHKLMLRHLDEYGYTLIGNRCVDGESWTTFEKKYYPQDEI